MALGILPGSTSFLGLTYGARVRPCLPHLLSTQRLFGTSGGSFGVVTYFRIHILT
jgi:hypothetical protein